MKPQRPASSGAVSGLRVLHVIYSFDVGGSEQLVLTLVRSMKRHTHGVVAVDLPGRMREEFESSGASTWSLDRVGNGKLKTIASLCKIVRDFRPDVVHTHHLHELIYAFPAALGHRARLLHTEHEVYSLRAPKRRLALRVLSRLCDAVTGVDEETVEYMHRVVSIPRSRLCVIRNGIDVEDYRHAEFDCESLGLNRRDLIVGVVARLEHVKGHDVLFRAFASVLQHVPQAALVVVGDGSRMGYLASLAQELGIEGRVKMLGLRRDVPRLLSAMHVVALSSREEGLPISLLEAMAAAKAIVATPVGGIPKLVEDGRNGILAPVDDAPAMAEAIHRLLTSPELRATLGDSARASIEINYSLEATVRRYQELYYGPNNRS